jgi:Ca-activated chloride channel family protein
MTRWYRMFVGVATWLLVGLSTGVYADVSDPIAGSVEAMLDGERVVLVSLENRYQVEVRGDLANVQLTQTFSNPFGKPINARYLFPLNHGAAVHAMTMKVGDEIVSAEIQEIHQAKKTFAKAKREGKAAALLEQHRPNMFTQKIANLIPGLPIEVVIEYAHTVPKIDGAYELVIPMVVGPRFQPAGAGLPPIEGQGPSVVVPASGTATPLGTWVLEQLPVYPPTVGVDLPDEILPERVSLRIELEAQVPLQRVSSDTHPIAIRHVSSTQQSVEFAAGKVLDNKDFVLRYQLAGRSTQAGLLSHWQSLGESLEGGYFSMLIEPPARVPDATALPREMVFLLDCSGSMSGKPMQASKRFMQQALRGLRPVDTFRIIRFSDSATEFSKRPLPATPANVANGLRYTQGLYGSGGTMMTSGIRQALSGPIPSGTIRNVVFLTDGYIGNEVSVLRLVDDLKSEARLFAFGVGAGVNRFLLDELGRVGRGFTRYFDPTRDDESLEAIAADLAARLQTPVLTDLQIDWGDLPVSDIVPKHLPDLYAGDSIRVTGKYSAVASSEITISGAGSGHKASIHKNVELTRDVRPAVRRIWGKNAVSEHMHSFITPQALRTDSMTNNQLQAAVTDLGLIYGLATKWTAFVAVSRRVYNPNPGTSTDAEVALPKVAGVTNLAYSQPAMTGYGAPEPGMLLGILVALLTVTGLRRLTNQQSQS